MKFLFIVQGEGRGHLTQAITLEEMLIRNGHEVVEILVGESSSRMLPGYFNRHVKAPVKRFLSPNFHITKSDKRSHLRDSVLHNLLSVPEYVRSMCYIHRRIRKSHADVVVNFFEVLTGLTYTFLRPSVPYVSVGHQYMFLHQDFEFPAKNTVRLGLLRLFTRLTSLRAAKRLALSFHPLPSDRVNNVITVPPLLRREITAIQPEAGTYIHGYMLNTGFAEDVAAFHGQHPEVPLRFFWDNPDAGEVTTADATLDYHQLDDTKFLNAMAGCRAYACTAGFESICEAMFLGKPVLMVPAHIEQDCNAHDAVRANAGIVSDSFDLDVLLKFSESYVPNREFVYWVRSAERRVISELESMEQQLPMPQIAFL